MQNYKVEVKNHSEVMEAQELFFNLGYSWFHKKFEAIEIKTPETIMCFENGALTTGIRGSAKHKQITLPELRDMVVLKKNDIGDATHENTVTGSKVYVGANSKYYFQDGIWNEYPCGVDIKPIQKEELKMKEYLVKTDTGYTLQVLSDVVDGHNGIIEVPKDAMSYWECNKHNVKFFSKTEKGSHFYHYLNKNSKWALWDDADFKTFEIKWQREELNDQVASAEQARQEQTKCKCSTKELHESNPVNDGQSIMDNLIRGLRSAEFSEGGFIPKLNHGAPAGVVSHGFSGFTQPEELPFVSDNAWSKQIGGDHYKKLAIQPMEYALKNKLDYAQANVVKYVTRHADKNGKQDLLKAIHNIELMIAHYYSDQE